jgi:hypothetical protein
MARQEPLSELDPRFSSRDATPAAWAEAERGLERAEVYWLTTVRPGGRPHVTPLIAVWFENALCFCTGPSERKAKNLARSPQCVITTGCNDLSKGLDLVVEGNALRVREEAKLRRIAAAYETKYGSDWRFEVRDGAFHGEGGEAYVFEVAPVTAFGFAKGEPFGQTRWLFSCDRRE